MRGHLPSFSQSITKASYDPLQPSDEHLRQYDAGAYETFLGHDVRALPIHLRLLRAIVNFPGAVFFPAYSPDIGKTLPRTGIINYSGLKKFVWYTRHGLGFTLIATFSVSFCGCSNWVYSNLLLMKHEPYRTFILTVFGHPRDLNFLALPLLGSGIIGTTIGLVFFLFFVLVFNQCAIGVECVHAVAKRKSRFTRAAVMLSWMLAPIFGLFAAAVGVALAPASLMLPKQFTAKHAISMALFGMENFSPVLIFMFLYFLL